MCDSIQTSFGWRCNIKPIWSASAKRLDFSNQLNLDPFERPRGHTEERRLRIILATTQRDVMSRSQAVAKYLPFLRRYARALTGTQVSGDAYVAATLEAMIAEPSLLDNCGNPRIELFQLFIKIFNSVSINQPTGSADIPRPPEQNIFITAYPQRFLTGERPEPAFLDLKAIPTRHGVGHC